MCSFELEGDGIVLHLVPTNSSSETEFCGELSELLCGSRLSLVAFVGGGMWDSSFSESEKNEL